MRLRFVYAFLLFISLLPLVSLRAQDITSIVQQTRLKLEKVNDYEAKGRMKTNVTFLKVPVATVKIYFKKPNRLKLKSEKGVSFIPKGAVSINLNNMLKESDFTIIDAGEDRLDGVPVRIAKLLPNDDNSDVVLSTLYIDPVAFLVRKAKTTTRENGSYELEMKYGKYAEYGLPDKIVFSFNTKDYKLPKGVTFDFDDGSAPASPAAGLPKNKKGKAEIVISQYTINQGVPDAVFQETTR